MFSYFFFHNIDSCSPIHTWFYGSSKATDFHTVIVPFLSFKCTIGIISLLADKAFCTACFPAELHTE